MGSSEVVPYSQLLDVRSAETLNQRTNAEVSSNIISEKNFI